MGRRDSVSICGMNKRTTGLMLPLRKMLTSSWWRRLLEYYDLCRGACGLQITLTGGAGLIKSASGLGIEKAGL